MASDRFVTMIVILSLVAHLAALLWLLRPRNRFAALLLVNVVVSAGVLAYQSQRLRSLLSGPTDQPILALMAFEIVVFAAALWALRGRCAALIASCSAFGLHLCARIAALIFMLTFKMTRLL